MWKKRISLITMIVIVICLITLSYFFNMERKQNQQYEAYLSQHIGNEISGMYPRLKENEENLNKIITTNTITKEQIDNMNLNYYRIIKNKVEMQQLVTHLGMDSGNQNEQNYSFFNALLDVTEFLKSIDFNKLKDSYSIALNNDDITRIKAIQSLHEEWLPIMKEYINVQGKTVKEHYWIDLWTKLDEVTNEDQELKDVIK